MKVISANLGIISLFSTVFCISSKEQAAIARVLVSNDTEIASLATIQRAYSWDESDGFPFSSPEMFVDDNCLPNPKGDIYFFLIDWGVHAKNIYANPKISMSFRDLTLYDESKASEQDKKKFIKNGWADTKRLTLEGTAKKVDPSSTEFKLAKECYIKKYPVIKNWYSPDEKTGHGQTDFVPFKLEVKYVRYIGGFGIAGWIPLEYYQSKDDSDKFIDDSL